MYIVCDYCTAGTTPVVFSWYKNDDVLLVEGGGQYDYTLNRVKMSDTGNYTCVVKNDFGSIQHRFNVEIYGKTIV